ncbi:MAG: HAMP domain-containing sensor histidine kinase [Halieaceae bacterium]|jgi:signal transduction histidine kinase|nr:HAMP domain-containing sensor histidine kinase [Halieaceae bacterium]
MNEEASAWRKRFERERAARKEAERLLELKSLELYEANQHLAEKVRDRTRELRSALDEAQAASKAKDRFLSSVSHELRTPLNAIMGFSQILAAKGDTPEALRPYLEKIHIAATSLLTLVNSILDVAKLESGKMPFNPKTFDLRHILTSIRAQTEPQAAEKHLKLVFTGEPRPVYGDSQLLTQAVLNLMVNAIKFSPPESTVTLAFELDAAAHRYRLTVKDQGIGISEAGIAALFKPFTQVHDKSTFDPGGTGLGLVIVKRVVDLHGGSITVDSEPGIGTQFTLELPLDASVEATSDTRM